MIKVKLYRIIIYKAIILFAIFREPAGKPTHRWWNAGFGKSFIAGLKGRLVPSKSRLFLRVPQDHSRHRRCPWATIHLRFYVFSICGTHQGLHRAQKSAGSTVCPTHRPEQNVGKGSHLPAVFKSRQTYALLLWRGHKQVFSKRMGHFAQSSKPLQLKSGHSVSADSGGLPDPSKCRVC